MRAAWESSDRIVSFMASVLARAEGVRKLLQVDTLPGKVYTGHMNDYLTTEEAAEYLRVRPATLKTWRSRGSGPEFYRPSPGIVRYTVADLDRWVQDLPPEVDNEQG